MRNARACVEKARELQEQGRIDEAMEEYRVSIAYGPLRESYLELAELLFHKGQYREAADMYAEVFDPLGSALQDRLSLPVSRFLYSLALYRAGDVTKAEKAYESARDREGIGERFPFHKLFTDADFAAAVFLAIAKNTSGTRFYEAALAANPDDPEALFGMGRRLFYLMEREVDGGNMVRMKAYRDHAIAVLERYQKVTRGKVQRTEHEFAATTMLREARGTTRVARPRKPEPGPLIAVP